MKNFKGLASLVLAFATFAVPLTLSAQVTSAGPAASAPNTCPCSDYRFAPKTEKAKAVAAFWDARRKYKLSAGMGSMVYVFTALAGGGRQTPALSDAENTMGSAMEAMMSARAHAAELHGLVVQGDGTADAPVLVTLKKGVDYTLTAP